MAYGVNNNNEVLKVEGRDGYLVVLDVEGRLVATLNYREAENVMAQLKRELYKARTEQSRF